MAPNRIDVEKFSSHHLSRNGIASYDRCSREFLNAKSNRRFGRNYLKLFNRESRPHASPNAIAFR